MAIRHKRKNSSGYTWQAGDLVEGQIGLNIADGTLHFIKSNGNYVNLGASTGGITDVVQDTTPQLGGNLDVGNYKIYNSNAVNVEVDTTGGSLYLTAGSITTPSAIPLVMSTAGGGYIQVDAAANGNITLYPNGTGDVYAIADTFRIGDSNAAATITTNGTGNLVLNTNSGTNAGSITLAQGVNGNITIAPNGTGSTVIGAGTGATIVAISAAAANTTASLQVRKTRTDVARASMDGTQSSIQFQIRDNVPSNWSFARITGIYHSTLTSQVMNFEYGTDGSNTATRFAQMGPYTLSLGDSGNSTAHVITTNGTHDLTLNTNSGTNSGTITIANGSNGNITVTPNGTGGFNTSGTHTVTYTPGTTTGSALLATGKDTQGGVGYFDFLKATNTTSGATNANKSFRLNSTGAIEVINSAYTSTILSLTDAGALTVGGTTFPTSTGTNGQVLTANGSGGATWSTPSGGGWQVALVTGSTTFYTGTKYVNWTTEDYDANGLVTVGSNGTFTISSAGTYLIQWITHHTMADPNTWQLYNQTGSAVLKSYSLGTADGGFSGFSYVHTITGSTVYRWQNPNTAATGINNTPQMMITKIA